jgi:hypothetical protein
VHIFAILSQNILEVFMFLFLVKLIKRKGEDPQAHEHIAHTNALIHDGLVFLKRSHWPVVNAVSEGKAVPESIGVWQTRV